MKVSLSGDNALNFNGPNLTLFVKILHCRQLLCETVLIFIGIFPSSAMVPEIGKDRFLGCYLFSTVFSGFASISLQAYRGLTAGSVGAVSFP